MAAGLLPLGSWKYSEVFPIQEMAVFIGKTDGNIMERFAGFPKLLLAFLSLALRGEPVAKWLPGLGSNQG